MLNEEKQIENDFLAVFAQLSGEEGEGQTGVSKADLQDASNILNNVESGELQPPEQEAEKKADKDGLFPAKEGDEEEARAVENLIPWDNFSIVYDPYYADDRVENQQLPLAKAKGKSFYILYAPENKRVEGIHNKRLVGGYGTKEELGEDLEWLKSTEVGSPEGFPPEWKNKLLKDMKKPPSIEQDTQTEANKENKTKELEQSENKAVPTSNSTTKAPQPSIPEPVGKASPEEMSQAAKVKERRVLRAELLKSL